MYVAKDSEIFPTFKEENKIEKVCYILISALRLCFLLIMTIPSEKRIAFIIIRRI
jgi:hypothetical protein